MKRIGQIMLIGLKLLKMSDIDWNSEHNVKILENIRQQQLQMLKSSSSLFDIDIKHPHPRKRKL